MPFDKEKQGEKDSNIYHRIGQLVELTGISHQTIRHYDSLGILKGSRDLYTGYRYFDILEVSSLIRTRIYRGYGFSLDEVIELFSSDLDSNLKLFERQEEKLKREMILAKLRLECLEKQKQDLKLAKEAGEKCFVIERPEMLGVFYRDWDTIIGDKAYRSYISNWISLAPIVQTMVFADTGNLSGKTPSVKLGLCMKKEYAALLDIHPDEFCFSIPSCKCVYTILRAEGDHISYFNSRRMSDPSSDQLSHALEYIGDSNYEIEGDLYASTFYAKRDQDSIEHFSHVWIPIK